MVWVCRLDTADLLFGSAALVKVMEFCCFDLQMQRIQFSFGTSQGPGTWYMHLWRRYITLYDAYLYAKYRMSIHVYAHVIVLRKEGLILILDLTPVLVLVASFFGPRRMKAAGVQPNVVAYASLARPFAHRGEWQEATPGPCRTVDSERTETQTSNLCCLQAVLIHCDFAGGTLC